MALETVKLAIGNAWSLVSAAAAGPFDCVVLSGGVVFHIGDAAPDTDATYGLPRQSMSFAALPAKVWARATGGTAFIACLRTVAAGENLAPVLLPAVGLSSTTFAANLAAGSEIATIAGRIAGDKIESISPNDGRVLLSSDGTKLVRGLSTLSAGDLDVTIVTSHPLAANVMRRTTIRLTVTAPTPAATVAPMTAADFGVVASEIAGYYWPIRYASYAANGPYATVEKNVNGTYSTMDVLFLNNVPDWASARAWNGGTLNGLSITRRYDQNGNGNHQLAAARADQPLLLESSAINGHVPLIQDGDIQVLTAPTPKSLRCALTTPLDRANFSFVSAFKARTPMSGNTYIELFQNADFTHNTTTPVSNGGALNGILIGGVGDAIGFYGKPAFTTTSQRIRSHLTTMAFASGPIGASAAQALVLRTMSALESPLSASGTTASSVPLLSYRIGLGSTGVNSYSGLDDFGMMLLNVGKTSAQLQAIEAAINARLGIKTSGHRINVINGRNSLDQGYKSTLNQNDAVQIGLGRDDGEFAAIQYFNLAVTGRTALSEFVGQRDWHNGGYDATKDANIRIWGEPTNDARTVNSGNGYADTAAAEAAALSLYTDSFKPAYDNWMARGPKAGNVFQTSLVDGGFVTNNATRHQMDFLNRYAQIIRDRVADGTLVGQIADYRADSRLQDATDATKFAPDQIHMINPGYLIQGQIKRNTLRAELTRMGVSL